MSIPTDEDRSLLTVVATMRAQPGKEEELQALLEGLIEPTRAEADCTTYALHRGSQDPAVFIFIEHWTDQAALDAHLGTPHLQAALPKIPELLDGELVITTLNRVA
ncbi:putative quinol monooxygenase [Pseudonocardia petroleophila]|uniref:Antibiotic biosynthesis monooxygenase n=1 Tax=Pseudonocardia petroleophila TaxID=37331 RepID=A0A7G7MFH0_9PSEU|nr:putative quinol monooxygenase [Pseudonocardia petroleophila]QNG51531.1 antibiotic biosynthesis monooxygenase [Pseudonocardia petroleophila]